MDPQAIEILEYVLNATITLGALYFDAILAAFIFILGYGLLRLGLEKLPPPASRVPLDYLRSLAPGGGFVLLGAVVFAVQDPLLLALFVLLLTVAAGFGLIAIGYRLLVQGVYQAGDRAEIWGDGITLIGRAGPGLVLGIVGLFIVVNGVLSAPDELRASGVERLEARAEVGEVLDARMKEFLELFRDAPTSAEVSPTED